MKHEHMTSEEYTLSQSRSQFLYEVDQVVLDPRPHCENGPRHITVACSEVQRRHAPRSVRGFGCRTCGCVARGTYSTSANTSSTSPNPSSRSFATTLPNGETELTTDSQCKTLTPRGVANVSPAAPAAAPSPAACPTCGTEPRAGESPSDGGGAGDDGHAAYVPL